MNIECKELNISSHGIKTENDTEKLRQYKLDIGFLTSDMKDKIEDYKVLSETEDISVAHQQWFKRIKEKFRLYKFLYQAIQVRMAFLKEQKHITLRLEGKKQQKQKQERNQCVERMFIENAKAILEEDVFYSIMDKSIKDAENKF